MPGMATTAFTTSLYIMMKADDAYKGISHNLAKDKVYSLHDIKPRLIRRMEMTNPIYHFPKPKIPSAWVMQCPMMRAVAYPTSDDAEISVPADSKIGRCKIQIL